MELCLLLSPPQSRKCRGKKWTTGDKIGAQFVPRPIWFGNWVYSSHGVLAYSTFYIDVVLMSSLVSKHNESPITLGIYGSIHLHKYHILH